MKKTLLAIYATENVGKTTSIKNFYEIFLSKHSSQIKNIFSFCEDDPNDVYKIVELQNGVKIGVCSFGDDGSSYEKLDNFAKQDCKVIVCASRTKGASVDSINIFVEESKKEIQEIKNNMTKYNVKWIHKSYFWDKPDYCEEKMLNNSFSESILELVEYYMVQ